MRSHKFYHPGHTSWTSEIDISVSKLLGFETFANFLRVLVSENLASEKKSRFRKIWSKKKASVSVSESLVSEKKSRFQRIWSRKNSLGFGFGKLDLEKEKIKITREKLDQVNSANLLFEL